MKSNIEARIGELRERLQLIENEVTKELAQQYSKQNMNYLCFLDRERAVYSFAIAELETVLAELEEFSR